MRTFVNSDYQSYKFWHIDVQGNRYAVHYGKVGTKGQRKTKEFDSEAQAQSAADKIIHEKLSDGYIETTSPATADPKRLAFEREILDNPDDLSTYAAYADYLNEQGDPQGEFMQVQIALENENFSAQEREELKKREEELLNEHQKEWVGEWAELAICDGPTGRGQLRFETKTFGFHRGLLTRIAIDELNLACARALVRSPQTRMVQDFRIGDFAYEEEDEYEDGPDIEGVEDPNFPAALAYISWPYWHNLRVFQFGWTSDEDYGDFCSFQCHSSGDDLHYLIKHMARLEELYLFAHGTDTDKIFHYSMPHLRVLQVYHTWNYPLTDLAKNESLKNLTQLLCHPHALEANEPYISFDDLSAILRSKHLNNLTFLRLRMTDFGDSGMKEIVESGILKRLRMLDLRNGCVTDEGVKLLVNCPDVGQLEFLDLSRNDLTVKGIQLLNQMSIQVDTSYPNDHEKETSEGYAHQRRYLYEGDYE